MRLEEDAACEDMGGLFFDVDGDGDEDLYVVSGGVEADGEGNELRDRLYLNQGDGKNFIKGELPDFRDSGGPVAAADFDRDGDLDLFVGGRVVPGAYPSTPKSRLLVNEGGSLTGRTDDLAPGLRESGMVTSAVWSDVNNDGWIDLLVTYEWGPVAVWINTKGKLANRSEDFGTSTILGWWNSITPGDFDGDGDMDYAVGNVGLNSKYEIPSYLYYGDFDGSGQKRLVEAEVEGDIVYPMRGKSCTTAAIPKLGEKFKTYREFAAAPLQEVFSLESLGKARKLEANTLASGWLRNEGGTKLTFVPFTDPLAQIAPVFSMVCGDFNHDGQQDLFLAQNSFSPQPETGRMDGGLSTVLLGDSAGNFRSLRADQSGIAIPADAKSAVLAGEHLLVGINDGPVQRYLLPTPAKNTIQLQLEGLPGNPLAYGARVTLESTSDNQPISSFEVTAGQGYLSQTSPLISFTMPKDIGSILVRWPNGAVTKVPPPKSNGLLKIQQTK